MQVRFLLALQREGRQMSAFFVCAGLGSLCMNGAWFGIGKVILGSRAGLGTKLALRHSSANYCT